MTKTSTLLRNLRGPNPDHILSQARRTPTTLLEDWHGEGAQGRAIDQAATAGSYRPLGSLLEAADLASSTSGVLNKVFGGDFVWAQFNAQAQIADSIPMSQRSRTSVYGWRAWTALGDTTGGGGQSEGTVPTAIIGSFVQVAPTIKEQSTQMRVSLLLQNLTQIDDAYGTLASLQMQLAVEHAKQRERAVTTDIQTLAGNNSESVDRLTASSSNQATVGWTAGREDIFGIDRSVSTWADAQQQAFASPGTTLTKKLLKDRVRAARQAGGAPTFIATGWDTWLALSTLYEPLGRVDIGVKSLATDKVNDAVVPAGLAVQQWVSHVEGLPVVPSDKAVSGNPSGTISRIYGLDISNPEAADKPRTGWDVVQPTRVYAAGAKSGPAPQAISFVGDSLLAVTQYELGCRFPAANFQLRDMIAP